MNFGVIFVSILSSFAYEIWYKDVLPWRMCGLSSRPSCDLVISYMLVFMVLNATFNKFQLYHGGQFYWWRNIPDLSQATNKLYPWPQKSHNCFQAYFRTFSISSFFKLQISRAKFNSIWPRQISYQKLLTYYSI